MNKPRTPLGQLGTTVRCVPTRTQRGFLSPALLMNPWVLAAIAAVLAIYTVVIYSKGYNSGYAEYLEYKAQVDAASTQADAENQARQLAAEQEGRRIRDSYQRDIDTLRHAHNSRLDGLRKQLRGCETMSITSRATAGLDEATTDNRSAAALFTEACLQLEKDCAATTLQTVHLQGWIKGVCK